VLANVDGPSFIWKRSGRSEWLGVVLLVVFWCFWRWVVFDTPLCICPHRLYIPVLVACLMSCSTTWVPHCDVLELAS